MNFNLDSSPKNNLWTPNTGLLNSNTFKTDMVKERVKAYLEHNNNGAVSPAVLWDETKAFLKNHC